MTSVASRPPTRGTSRHSSGWACSSSTTTQFDEAERYLRRAKELFPEYSGLDSPAWFLSRVHLERGDTDAAIAELASLTSVNEAFLEANLEEARLREETGDLPGAADAMDRAIHHLPVRGGRSRPAGEDRR